MELASPLMPTVVLNPNSFPALPFHDSETEPELLSLPFSPPTSTRTTRRTPGSQEIEMVQAALDAARTHLAQKEEALVQLRAEMERFQLEVRARTRSDGDGG